VLLLTLGGMCAAVAGIIWGFSQMDKDTMDLVSTSAANILLLTIIVSFILAGMRKKINVYDAFIEGAKEGFQTAVRIIPYLVAILVGIGIFRASGAMDVLIDGIKWGVVACGMDSDFVGALPTAHDYIRRRLIRGQTVVHIPRQHRHYLLHPCSVFRQRGHTQHTPCRDMRTACRPCRHRLCHSNLLSLLRIENKNIQDITYTKSGEAVASPDFV